MARLIIHVGYAKAASTFLQEQVFPQQSKLKFLGKRRADYPRWLIDWHYLDDLAFAERRHGLRQTMDALRAPDHPTLLSSEVFTMHGGGAPTQAERILQVAPDAHILVMLRDPIARLLSFYKHLVARDGLSMPLAECIDWHRTPFVFYKRRPIYLADYYYDELISHYSERFGGRVHVLRFEDLMTRPDHFCQQLSFALGVHVDGQRVRRLLRAPENVGVPDHQVPRLRLDNALASVAAVIGEPAPEALVARPATVSGVGLSAELRQRLETALAGRCAGYY